MPSRKSGAGSDKLWSAYTAGVKRQPTRKVSPDKATLGRASVRKADKRDEGIVPVTLSVARKAAVAALPKNMGGMEPDRREGRKLRQGDVVIDARIDLHGMTQAKAHQALGRFMERAVVAGHRILLVITGMGAGGQGVLRREVPNWLRASEWGAAIRHITPAAIQHGGAGAIYVVLRKLRSD